MRRALLANFATIARAARAGSAHADKVAENPSRQRSSHVPSSCHRSFRRRAVRLAKGDYHAVTVYNDDPAYQAQLFEEAGATWLHVVDLDGAKSGNPDNLEVVRAILARTSLKVEVGGGVRSLEAADRLLDAGATRVI